MILARNASGSSLEKVHPLAGRKTAAIELELANSATS